MKYSGEIEALLFSATGLGGGAIALSLVFALCLLVLWRRPRGINGAPIHLDRAASQIMAADRVRRDEDRIPSRRSVPKRQVRKKLRQVLPGLRLLWVDDHPEFVAGEREAFARAGWDVTSVRTNDAAMDEVAAGCYDVIISDIGREEDFGPSGLYLFEQMLDHSDIDRIPPIVFYSSVPLDDIGRRTDNEDEYLVRVDWELSESQLLDVVFPGEDRPVLIPSTHRPLVLLDLVLRAAEIDRMDPSGRLSPWYQDGASA